MKTHRNLDFEIYNNDMDIFIKRKIEINIILCINVYNNMVINNYNIIYTL